MLADPVGVVVGLLCGAEPGLDRQAAGDLVRCVAAGRAKRRRLAQALLDKPSLLVDGRSPAPRVAGNLLIALRRAGAVIISPPVCAGCGKQLRTLQRRGQDWYCGACGPRPEPCALCGLSRPVCVRDRAGRPRCAACQPGGSDGDPAAIVAGIIAVIDPDVLAGTIMAAVHAAAPGAGQRRRLAWALQDHPGLLTGAGARAPVPSVLRLIDALADAGAQRIVRPACPHCGRVIALVKPRDGVRLCRNCVARSRAVTCSRCGVVREAATRDEHGRPLCPYCLISDPANLETCISCARRRVVSVRTPGGPLCPACRPAEDDDLLDLRAPGSRRDLQDHRRAVVQRLPEAARTLRRLRQRPAGSRRDDRQPALRDLHQPRVAPARLPGMRRAHPAPLAPVCTLFPAAAPR